MLLVRLVRRKEQRSEEQEQSWPSEEKNKTILARKKNKNNLGEK
jgi:hypothetical protein